MTCGEVKAIDGGPPLVCTQPPGHELPHGVGTPPYARWPVTWTAALPQKRAIMDEPHKKRARSRGQRQQAQSTRNQ
jgi:hypothetical protein